MNRRISLLAAGALAAVLVTAYGSAPAVSSAAPPTAPGSAHSQAAYAPTTSVLTPKVTTTGALSLLSPLISGVVNPLLSALTTAPQTLLTQATGALSGAGLQADNPTARQARPTSGYPNCATQGWDATDCYGPLVPTFAAGSLLSLGTGTVQGYATGDNVGYIAAAHSANPELNLLGIDLGNLGVVDATAACTPTTCTATRSVTGGSLLGGALTYSIANGSVTAQVNNATIPASGVTVPAAGVTTKVTLGGNLLTLQVGLSVAQLFNGLGLGAALGLLGGLASTTGSAITLTVTIGSGGTVVAGTSATSYGLDVGVDLNVNLVLNLLPVLGVSLAGLAVTTSGPAPDLLDLKLAYATAVAGALPTQWVPPALI